MKTPRLSSVIFALLLLCGLVLAPEGAVQGARSALEVCGSVMVSCLFPFFVVSFLCSRLALPQALGHWLREPMELLFGVSGTGAGVFMLGILGGYPVGASVIGDLVRREELSAEEGGRLVAFCNNSGPAFLMGAVGVGVFGSSAAGLLLYAGHILGAVVTGLFLSGTRRPQARDRELPMTVMDLSQALPEAISAAAMQTVQICGYVIFFGAMSGCLEQLGVFSAVYGTLAAYTGLTLRTARGLCMGLLELGCGIGAMEGAAMTAQSLTICAVLTGFGGLSVAMQTAGVLRDTGIPISRHLLGRVCCGGISGFFVYTFATMFL